MWRGARLHSAIRIPLQKNKNNEKNSKMPFALFVGTSNLHSVQCVRNRFVTRHQLAVVQARSCFLGSSRVVSGQKMCALKSLMSQVLSSTSAKVFVGPKTWGGSAPHPKFLLVGLRPPQIGQDRIGQDKCFIINRAPTDTCVYNDNKDFRAIITDVYICEIYTTIKQGYI